MTPFKLRWHNNWISGLFNFSTMSTLQSQKFWLCNFSNNVNFARWNPDFGTFQLFNNVNFARRFRDVQTSRKFTYTGGVASQKKQIPSLTTLVVVQQHQWQIRSLKHAKASTSCWGIHCIWKISRRIWARQRALPGTCLGNGWSQDRRGSFSSISS